MRRKLLDQSAFRRLADVDDTGRAAVVAPRSRAEGIVGSEDNRIVRFTLSDGSIDRMGDTINPNGFVLENFRRNPVCLWGHRSDEPPIGRLQNVHSDGSRLIGDVRFMPPETYGFADTIYRMVIEGWIKAGSIGFLPIDYAWANDDSRPHGIDFKRQELLEFSICPVPANANALVEAKRMGFPAAHVARAAPQRR